MNLIVQKSRHLCAFLEYWLSGLAAVIQHVMPGLRPREKMGKADSQRRTGNNRCVNEARGVCRSGRGGYRMVLDNQS